MLRFAQYGDRPDCPKAPFFAPRGRSGLSPYCANLCKFRPAKIETENPMNLSLTLAEEAKLIAQAP